MDRRLSLALVLVVAAGAGCKKDPPRPAAQVDAAAPAPLQASAANADKIVAGACMSCHTEEMLAQQRLTEAQWTKVVTKMAAWGANLEAGDKEALIAHLAKRYGPDAGSFEPALVPAAAAASALEPTDDGPFAGGDAEHGRALYVDRCSGCHGPTALGHIGVRLVDRPLLYRAADVAEVVRKGRGKMPPAVIADRDLADILAHLRGLKPRAP